MCLLSTLLGKFKVLNAHYHIYSPPNIGTYIFQLLFYYYQLYYFLRINSSLRSRTNSSFYSRMFEQFPLSPISARFSLSWIMPINIQLCQYFYLKRNYSDLKSIVLTTPISLFICPYNKMLKIYQNSLPPISVFLDSLKSTTIKI